MRGDGRMMGAFWAFLGVSLLVIITPGPDTALTIRNTLLGGRRGGICTALGVVTGQAVWASAASVGLVALLAASAPVFVAVRLAGAAYLMLLGAQALRGALWAGSPARPARDDPAPRRLAPVVALRQGVLSALGNPKLAVFFTSLLPQFMPPGGVTAPAMAGHGLVFCALTLLWLTGYACVVAVAGDLLRRPAMRGALEGITGAVLIALGVRVATEYR